MSDYRRLISYLYVYEGGVKGANTGYAKVEVRNGQCRIYVNVRRIYLGGNDIGVYLLTGDKEIRIGKIFIRGGCGEFRTTVNAQDIDGAGWRMEMCHGLTIHDVENAWKCYTTIWEDAVTHAAEIDLADVTSENTRRKEAAQEKAVREKEERERTLREGTVPPEELPISAQIEKDLQREEDALKDVAPWNEGSAGEKLSDHRPVAENMVMEKPVEKQLPADDQPVIRSQENRLWSRMQREYAKVLAFDYDKGCEILSIKPQDIGLLPRDVWIYGNNSFLLHGYYHYRHLILARLEDLPGEPRYLLGVPGRCYNNEKNMAAMFGFPCFVPARKQPDEDGKFGYWYTLIHL